MVIFFTVDSYPSKNHPFSSFISTICCQFAKKNKVIVIAPQSITRSIIRRSPLLPKKEVFENGIEAYRPYSLTLGDGKFRGRLTLMINKLVTTCTMKKISKKTKPDIIYSHFWANVFNAVGFAKSQDIPLFASTGEDIIKLTKYLRPEEIELIKSTVKGCIAVSTKNLQESVVLGLISAEKCVVLPNSVNNKVFKKLNKEDCREKLGFDKKDFIVAFVGRFTERKGSKRVAEAISLIDDDIKSVFIGSSMADEKLACNPNCKGILHSGIVPNHEIPTYLNASDVFVLPTLAEGCCNAIIEAMACGLPIISSDLSFNYDILNESNSIMVDPMNTEAISKAIVQLKENTKLRDSMSENALLIAKDLTIENRVSKIFSFINSCLSDAKK